MARISPHAAQASACWLSRFGETIQLAKTNGFGSGLEKPLETLSSLFVSEILATLQSLLAASNGFDEALFFLEIARHHIQDQVVRISSLLGG